MCLCIVMGEPAMMASSKRMQAMCGCQQWVNSVFFVYGNRWSHCDPLCHSNYTKDGNCKDWDGWGQ